MKGGVKELGWLHWWKLQPGGSCGPENSGSRVSGRDVSAPWCRTSSYLAWSITPSVHSSVTPS